MSSWPAVLKGALKQFTRHDITDRAAALTYFGVLSLFPAMLVLVSILGMLGKDTTDRLLDNIGQLAPGGVQSFVRSIVEQTQGRAGAASLAAVFGILLAIWSASGYVASFMRATNTIYGVGEGRPAWKKAPVRYGVTLAVMLVLVLSAAIVLFTGSVARQFGHAIGLGDGVLLAWDIAKWPVLLVLVSVMFSLLYWACPNVKQPGFRLVTAGGLVAVFVWLVASGAFGLYVSFAGSYNKTYGSLATVIIFLVWLWITNIAILLGAEVNAERERQRAVAAGLPENVEPFMPVRDASKLTDPQKEQVDRAEKFRSGEPLEPPEPAEVPRAAARPAAIRPKSTWSIVREQLKR